MNIGFHPASMLPRNPSPPLLPSAQPSFFFVSAPHSRLLLTGCLDLLTCRFWCPKAHSMPFCHLPFHYPSIYLRLFCIWYWLDACHGLACVNIAWSLVPVGCSPSASSHLPILAQSLSMDSRCFVDIDGFWISANFANRQLQPYCTCIDRGNSTLDKSP